MLTISCHIFWHLLDTIFWQSFDISFNIYLTRKDWHILDNICGQRLSSLKANNQRGGGTTPLPPYRNLCLFALLPPICVIRYVNDTDAIFWDYARLKNPQNKNTDIYLCGILGKGEGFLRDATQARFSGGWLSDMYMPWGRGSCCAAIRWSARRRLSENEYGENMVGKKAEFNDITRLDAYNRQVTKI